MNPNDKDYVGAEWVWEDIQSNYPWLHRGECEELLDRHASQLQEGMITAGWEIIYDMPDVRSKPDGWCACNRNRTPVEYCDVHLMQAEKDYPQGWRYYAGDTCKHGKYLGGMGIDLMCGPCEMGD